ncbi:creatininase [Massilia sp. Root133]|uniref:creatininase family protein n=1 Tax=unclassified Massilia TaxID=2609279 RepID=UPI000702240A|nr:MULTISPECIES: creatininase family protein [unclassified Massilia]KQY16181.1 creatininase [Massilia sp. Root133]KQZ46793.1 creatininase [Massilia sp. Root1485]
MFHLHISVVRRALAIAGLALPLAGSAASSVTPGVYLEEMTSPELRDRIVAGATTALVPIGGTEQSGPHIVLGKHNVRARVLAGRIAAKLGDAVVAPVVAYVPEGAIAPPAAHMRFAGTISIPDAAFEALLESTAKSLCQHGIRDVFFLGDHGGYQTNEARAAARVNRSNGGAGGCRAHALGAYYDAATTTFNADLKQRGFTDAEIGTHAGLADTALSLAVDPALVRPAQVAAGARGGVRAGVHGDPTRATADLGRVGVERIVDASVAAIRAARAPSPNSSHRK